jgi:hypothetical protein
MKNLMNSLGITDDINDTKVVADGVNDSSSDINILGKINYNEFSSFVQQIYMNCKRFGIKPDMIFSWIIDLFSWHSPSNNSSSSLNDKQEKVGREDNRKPWAFNIQTPASFLGETESRLNPNLDNTIINSDSIVTINNITSDLNTKQNGVGGSLVHQILFISQISNYISKKKKKSIELENYKKEFEKNIKIKE